MNYKVLLVATASSDMRCQPTITAVNTPVLDEYLEVVQDDFAINVEESLAASNTEYFCKETWTTGENLSESRRVCHIKSPKQNQLKKLGGKVTDVSGGIIVVTGKALATALQFFGTVFFVKFRNNK